MLLDRQTRDKAAVRAVLDRVKADRRSALSAPEAKEVADAYGLPVPQEGLATSADDAAQLAQKIGFPVVLKIVSPDILHKTEAGGVLVGVADAQAARSGYDTIVANAKKYQAGAQISGVQVQQMLPTGAQEVIVGAVTDPSFGKLVAFGLGGVLVEVLKDVTFSLAPATRDDALSMLDGIASSRDAQRRARCGAGRPRRARRDRRGGVAAGDRFPGDQRSRPEPGVRDAEGATAVDVRILVDFDPPEPRYRPAQDEIVRAMNRIMRPDSVAVIGASSEDGKIGNSVMKNLVNGGYAARSTRSTEGRRDLGYKAYASVKDIPGPVDVAVFAIPAKFVAAALVECGEKEIPGAVLIPSGFAETGNEEGSAR